MNESLGFSVRIFVPSGDPEGPRVIEKSNWTGQGLIFPRSLFAEVRHHPYWGIYPLAPRPIRATTARLCG